MSRARGTPIRRNAARAAALLLATALGGCSESAPPARGTPSQPRTVPATTAVRAPEPELFDPEAMRGLGYADFSDELVEPGEESVSLLDRERSWPGYNLYCVRNSCTALLIDAEGQVVHSWSDEEARHWSNVELIEGGDLLVVGSEGGEGLQDSVAHYLMRLSWDGTVVWKIYNRAHHDVELTPSGDVVALTSRDLAPSAEKPGVPVIDNLIERLGADGNKIEEFSLHDILSEETEAFELLPVSAIFRGKSYVIDLFHANSLEFMRHEHLVERSPIYAFSNVLVSMRYQDAVAIIDLEARRAVWSWGPGEIRGPHNATVLENGNVLLYDNGLGRGWSRVVEVDPLTDEIVWQYGAEDGPRFYSPSRGSNQRLPNGNTLIADSDAGEAFEVTPEGEMVWRFRAPFHDEQGHRATIVRIKRYPLELLQPLLDG